jgi:hypothetical protein
MWFSSLTRNSKQSGVAERRAQPGPRQRSSFRPRLEALEDRWMPSILTVSNNLSSGTGSLQAEIAAAKSGDTIVFAPNMDGQTIRGGLFDITKNLTIQGPGTGHLTINAGGVVMTIRGRRVFKIENNVHVTLSGLTITGGNSNAAFDPTLVHPYDGKGGGILNLGTLSVDGCNVSGNFANYAHGNGYGAGIYNAGALTVSNSIISGNSAGYYADMGGHAGLGGGIYNAGTLTVTASTLSGNIADWGGGIFNAGTLMLGASTLSGNIAHWGGSGGGIYNYGTGGLPGNGGNFFPPGGAGTLTVDGCTISANQTTFVGGGIYNAGTNAGMVTVRNSVFSGNYASGGVGGATLNIFGPFTDEGDNTFS